MSEASRLREAERYGARDDEVTPLRWPSSSWCNPSQDNEKSRPFWTGLFLRRRGGQKGARETCKTCLHQRLTDGLIHGTMRCAKNSEGVRR